MKKARPSYLRLLSDRSVLFLWLGELVSQSGDYMFAVALPWLVLLSTGSAFYVSLASAISWTPLLLSSFVGVYVDRINRKRMIVAGNIIQGSVVTVMAIMYVVGIISLPSILAFVFVLYFFDQLVSIAINAILPKMVKSNDELGATNGLFSISSSTNRIVGYVISGSIIAVAGVTIPILYDGLTFYFAALVTLVFVSSTYGNVRSSNEEIKDSAHSLKKGFRTEFIDGARFVKSSRLFLELGFVGFLANFFTGGTSAVLAPYVANALHAGSFGFGVLLSALGAGGAVGSFVFGKINARKYAGRLFFGMAFLIGAALLVMGLIPNFYVALLMIFVFGSAGTLASLPLITLIQAKVPNEMFGRVFTVLVTIMNAAAPVAAVIAGELAQLSSTQSVFMYFGIGTVLTVSSSYVAFRQLRLTSY
jgi:MFS family permease